MRTHHTAALLAVVAALAVTACDPQGSPASDKPGGGKSPAPSAPSAPAPARSGADAKAAKLPDFVGMGLQAAQDAAQAAGFYRLKSHDALGRDRVQAFDRNWKVCSQTPVGGRSMDTDTAVDFGTVKLEETCPTAEVRPPKPAGNTMPNFVGRGMKAVRSALPSNASITVKDALGSRMVFQESNWKVCTQDPESGGALKGQPLAFTVVKTDEACP
ncbi:hypothetical protein ACM614_23975 [Streptomyces sp. 12297]